MEQQDDLPDYYNILGVDRNVDENNLYIAYTVLVKKHSLPPGASPALEHRRDVEFAIYQKAYDILSNPLDRRNYDLQLKNWETKKRNEIYVQNKLDTHDSEREMEIRKHKKEKEEVERIKAELRQQEMLKAEEKFVQAKQFLEKRKDDEAIDILKQLVEKFPKVARYHSYLGLGMQSKGWTGYSQAEFKVALHFDPKDPIALKNYQKPEMKQEIKPEVKKTGFFSNLFRKK